MIVRYTPLTTKGVKGLRVEWATKEAEVLIGVKIRRRLNLSGPGCVLQSNNKDNRFMMLG
jgi:hypothetical protein